MKNILWANYSIVFEDGVATPKKWEFFECKSRDTVRAILENRITDIHGAIKVRVRVYDKAPAYVRKAVHDQTIREFTRAYTRLVALDKHLEKY